MVPVEPSALQERHHDSAKGSGDITPDPREHHSRNTPQSTESTLLSIDHAGKPGCAGWEYNHMRRLPSVATADGVIEEMVQVFLLHKKERSVYEFDYLDLLPPKQSPKKHSSIFLLPIHGLFQLRKIPSGPLQGAGIAGF